jgi:hypothetical protein
MLRAGFKRNDPSQPWGYFEDRDFVALNDALLETAGGSWQEPPTQERIQGALPHHIQEMQALVGARAKGHKVWGFKDPRLCVTARLWYRVLVEEGHEPRYLYTYRPREDTVFSLLRRNGGNSDPWRDLYDTYTGLALTFLKGAHEPYLSVPFVELVSGNTNRQCERIAVFVRHPEKAKRITKYVHRREP